MQATKLSLAYTLSLLIIVLSVVASREGYFYPGYTGTVTLLKRHGGGTIW
jgi:hypothetical protein